MSRKILIVDDEKNMRELLKDLFELEGFLSDAVKDGEEALSYVENSTPDLMVLDLRLPGIQGMEVLKILNKKGREFPVLIITAHGDINTAVDALKNGAADFIVKPFDNSHLITSIKKALETSGFVKEAGLSSPLLQGSTPEIIGDSEEIKDVCSLIRKIAGTTATVFINGESGTGKELVARAIHMNSERNDGPMISVNCAALPDALLESELFGYERGAFTGAHSKKTGKIELADGGTLFLDEVGDLSLSAQAKLLRVLEEKVVTPLGSDKSKKVDIRIISATNKDLPEKVKNEEFREDLFFRLNVVPVLLPALRQRKKDIKKLAIHFFGKYCKKYNIDDISLDNECLKRFEEYVWPGNIRELEHVIEKYVVLREIPIPNDTYNKKTANTEKNTLEKNVFNIQNTSEIIPLKKALKIAERQIILNTLRTNSGNKKLTADALGISYKTLFNKIHEHKIRTKKNIR